MKRIDYDNLYPNLLRELHKEKNKFDSLNKYVGRDYLWWRCTRFPGHIWRAQLQERIRGLKRGGGTGCAICYKVVCTYEESVAFLYPEHVQYFDRKMNGWIKPEIIRPNSNLLIHFKCSKSSEHIWKVKCQTQLRRKKSPCPFCNETRASKTYNLFTEKPELLIEWDEEKNKGVDKTIIMPNSKKFFSGDVKIITLILAPPAKGCLTAARFALGI